MFPTLIIVAITLGYDVPGLLGGISTVRVAFANDVESSAPVEEVEKPLPAEALTGWVISIEEGDTLTLLVDRTEHRIRLAQIDAPEKGQNWSTRAKHALSEKVFRRQVRVDVVDRGRYGRLVGQIWLGRRDINREMVREGHAWVDRRYFTDKTLLDDEAAARGERIGLWRSRDPVPPWEWRRGTR